MRYIAVFLVLVNLAYLGWNLTRPQQISDPALAARPLLNTGIVTLSEFERDSESQAQLNAVAAQQCSLVSGFPALDEAEQFLLEARNAGHLGALQLSGEALPSHFRLFLEPASSRSVATITLDGISERLQAENLNIDSYLITRGALENAVALGIYEDEEAARRILEQVQALGYSPVLDEIRRSDGEIQVWLRPAREERINEPEWLDLTGERPNLTRSENLCETLVQAPQFQ